MTRKEQDFSMASMTLRVTTFFLFASMSIPLALAMADWMFLEDKRGNPEKSGW